MNFILTPHSTPTRTARMITAARMARKMTHHGTCVFSAVRTPGGKIGTVAYKIEGSSVHVVLSNSINE